MARSLWPRPALGLRDTAWLLPASLLVACGGVEAFDAPSPAPSPGDDYIIEGELPGGVDLEAVVADLSPGGFVVVADPGTGQVATITSTSSPLARVASGEFSVAVAASCPDCVDPGCSVDFFRTINISLTQDSGPSGEQYQIQTTRGVNFTSPMTTPASWTSAVGEQVDLSTVGELPTCAPFSHYFDVIGEEEPPDDDCDDPFDPACTVELYTQHFNGLPDSGSADKSDFEAALPGWALHNNNDGYGVSTGSSTAGAIYSFGASGSTERALGGVASNATSHQYWGFCYTNATGDDLTGITLQYTGEQWRDSGNSDVQFLAVDVSVASSVATGLASGQLQASDTGDPATGWANVPGLTFESPQTGSAGLLDGNAPENRETLMALVYDGVVASGDAICVRWVDTNFPGSDHGLATDDVVLRGLPLP